MPCGIIRPRVGHPIDCKGRMQRRNWDDPSPLIETALYARVSTEDQQCDLQLDNLRAYSQRSGWVIKTEYIEKLSAKEGCHRPQLERLLFDARLKQDPLRCLQGLSRNRTVVAAWTGTCARGWRCWQRA